MSENSGFDWCAFGCSTTILAIVLVSMLVVTPGFLFFGDPMITIIWIAIVWVVTYGLCSQSKCLDF